MSEAFIPPAPATPEPNLEQLRDELKTARRELEAARKRELERQPLFDALDYMIERRIERWIESEYGREQLGRVIEDLQGSAIDDAIERALSDATVEVEAYIRP
jgi:hypothetical protein